MQSLVTGFQSGLGKYLHREMAAHGFGRQTPFEAIRSQAWDCIIHCAFNPRKDGAAAEENLALTKRLALLPHKKFVFISTIEVYPAAETIHRETDFIAPHPSHNPYALAKLSAESAVRAASPRALIIRAGALLGRDARPNSLVTLLLQPEAALRLSAASRFYYLLHSDLHRFIRLALAKNLQGIYNAVPNTSVTLGEMADFFNKKPRFGSFTYDAGNICNEKIKGVDATFDVSSKEIARRFADLL